MVNRIRVSEPTPRPGSTPVSVAAAIPASVLASRAAADSSHVKASDSTCLPDAAPATRRTQRDLQEEQGGAGVYSLPLQAHWSLKKPEWVHDIIPEIMDGKNILDFVDPEIDARLGELEVEEEQRAELSALQEADDAVAVDHDHAEVQATLSKLAKSIRKKKERDASLTPCLHTDACMSRDVCIPLANLHKPLPFALPRTQGVIKEKARISRKNNHPTMSRKVAARGKSVVEFVEHMDSMGVHTNVKSVVNLRVAAKQLGGAGELPARQRRGRSLTRDDTLELEGSHAGAKRLRANQVPSDRSSAARDAKSLARSRSPSSTGMRDEASLSKAQKLGKRKQFKLNHLGRASESDRHIHEKLPKHLFSGKRGNGKTDRR